MKRSRLTLTVLQHEVFVIFHLTLIGRWCHGLSLREVRCWSDSSMEDKEGVLPDRSRFPWLGVVQHSFLVNDKVQYAITTGVLVHPGYVMASAEDIVKIPKDNILNRTNFVVWVQKNEPATMGIVDYILHPEYVDRVTVATIALVKLEAWHLYKGQAPVLPVCLPLRGGGTFDSIFTLKLTDVSTEIEKEMWKMFYVTDADCREFYYRAQLAQKSMSPVSPLCATQQNAERACVWDAGAVLVARFNTGFWTLLGWGSRGPGCAAPTRFLAARDYVTWIEQVIFADDYNEQHDDYRLHLRQLSRGKVEMVASKTRLPPSYGQCERGKRGGVVYKESDIFSATGSYALGFFFVEVWQVAQFSCVVITVSAASRTVPSLWVENHCHGAHQGLAPWIKSPSYDDEEHMECFVFFKSSAFIEFRFQFHGAASLEVTMYGTAATRPRPPMPQTSTTTDAWWPTDKIIRWESFVPYYTDPKQM